MEVITQGWKTKLLALAVAITGAIELVDPTLITSLFGESYRGYVLIALGAVTASIKHYKSQNKETE